MSRQIEGLSWVEMVPRRPFGIETVQDTLTHLAALTPRGPVVWEIRGNGNFMRYLLGAEKKHLEKIKGLFRAHGKVEFYPAPEESRPAITVATAVSISRPTLPLKTNNPMSVIRAALADMAVAWVGGETVMQVILGPSYGPTSVPHQLADPTASLIDVVLGNARPASAEAKSAIREKTQHHGFTAAIRIGASGKNAQNRIYGVLGAIRILEAAGVRISAGRITARALNAVQLPWRFPLRLSVVELAHFMLLPAGEEELAGTPPLHPKPLPPPQWYKNPSDSKQERTFAISTDVAESAHLCISPKDSLQHTVLLGPTGCGKSTAMLRLALADIEAGRSVLLVDPKQDLCQDIIARIPESRKDDLVVIDPSSEQTVVGFNPLALPNYRNPSLIADAIFAVFREIFSENFGIRTQEILSAALLTLADTPGASLLWLPALLTNTDFRQKITAGVKDEIVLKPFWEQFEAMSDSGRRQEIAPVMNKMRQFFFRPGLRCMLGQSNPKFNLTDLFNKRRIVLVPLNKGVIGAESARLIGSLLVSLTWTLALSRANTPPEKRHIVSVYLDELQDYISLPTDLSDALAQARGLGLALTMAHQFRDQLPKNIRSAIDANCQNKIAYGLHSDDAKDMAAMAHELTSQDFMRLPRYHIYTSFLQEGRSTGWIQGRTLPPPPAIRKADELKLSSATLYGKSAAEVEAEYLKAVGQVKLSADDWGEAKVGRRKI